MGFGDDLMITFKASKIKKKFPDHQVIVGDVKKKQAFHSLIYDNNPNISDCRKLDLNKPVHIIDYHNGNRPYINYVKSLETNKYVWNTKYKPIPGELYFSETENLFADQIITNAIKYWNKNNNSKYEAIIFLETSSTKLDDLQFGLKHKNKDWGLENWSSLINILKKKYLIIQSMHKKSNYINGIYQTKKINFREACAILNKCNLYVGPEGGFGHAAAALNKKAVLYFGGWISPKIMGYDFHINLYYNNINSPCGEFKKICSHCEDARKNITVKKFEESITKVLNNI